MGVELFVYYRVAADQVDEALAIVTAFQARLRNRHPALRARILRRPEVSNGCQTWMETYAVESDRHDDGVTADLRREIESLAGPLRTRIDGLRHVEVFEPLSPG